MERRILTRSWSWPGVLSVTRALTALIAKKAMTKVPIVVTVPADPVATGLVASLARPGGNVTGLSFVGTELAGGRLVPRHRRRWADAV
jgi:ABC transporter substrate binding protein